MNTQSLQKFSIIVFSSMLAACTIGQKTADLNAIYQRSAQYNLPDRNPVIVIPGVLGSELVDDETGKTVWGAFRGTYADPRDEEDIQLIALPISAEVPFKELKDGVRSNGVLETLQVSLLGIPLNLRAYFGILTTLGAGGYADQSLGQTGIDYGDDHFTCFQFDYDWRRDNVENAARLKQFIDEKRAYIQAEYKERYGIENADVKFDIVAHSMGGLITRYFLRYGDAPLAEYDSVPEPTWAGVADVETVVLVGPPNGGATKTFEQLINGYDDGRPVLPLYPSYLMGTFPSVYQLLPRSRQNRILYDDEAPIEDIYDGELWARYGWGLSATDRKTTEFIRNALPDVTDDASRREIASAYQTAALKRAKAFHQALDMPAQQPEGLNLFLVAGDATQTQQLVTVDRKTGEPRVTGYGPGDGTVPRYSALADERISGEWEPYLVLPINWSGVTFLSSSHLGLTSDPAFADNVLYKLLEAPRSATPTN